MKNIIVSVLSAIVAAYLTVQIVDNSHQAGAVSKETAYERVLRTSVLKCSYGLWEPAVMRDPNTGELSGLIYDLMQEAGKALNIKIEFDHEIDWSAIATDLQAQKADAHCAGVWATPARGRQMAFTDPVSFLPAVAFVKANDKRFDQDINAINSPDVTIAIIDDDVSEEIATRDFPLAKRIARPQLGNVEDLLMMVADGKADITFDGPNRYKPYDAANPGKLRMLSTLKPIRIFPNTIAVDIHEQELLQMLNTTIHQLQDNGTFDRLKQKYAQKYLVDFLLPVVRPYDWQAWNSELNQGK